MQDLFIQANVHKGYGLRYTYSLGTGREQILLAGSTFEWMHLYENARKVGRLIRLSDISN